MAWERGFPGEGHISAGAPGEGPRDPPLPSPRYARLSRRACSQALMLGILLGSLA